MTEEPSNTFGPRRCSATGARYIRPPDSDSDVGPGDIIELQEMQPQDNELTYSSPSNSSGDELRVITRRTTSRALAVRADARRRRQARSGIRGKITRFWMRNVTLVVPQKSNRDYFALERTFLAYIRTSVAIAQQGVLIAQLFRLQVARAWAERLGFRQVGVPLSVSCYSVAIFIAFVGACRFWTQQHAIARGKIRTGGWELNFIGISLGCIIVAMFGMSVVIILEVEWTPPAIGGQIFR